MRVFISCGEVSGDRHAGELAEALRLENPDIVIAGLGGNKLKAAADELFADPTTWSTIGVIEPLRYLFSFLFLWRKVRRIIKTFRPDRLICIDFQGFNSMLAKYAKKLGIPVIYYVPPQEWIWGTTRGVQEIVRNTDLVLCIFPAAADFYKKHGANTKYIGNPFLDRVQTQESKTALRKKYGWTDQKLVCALMPGSRRQEINLLLPEMLQLIKHRPGHQYIIVAANDIGARWINRILRKKRHPLPLIVGQPYEVMKAADLLITSSGTITLEATCLGSPLMVLYKLSFISYLLARYVLKVSVKYIALPNIMAGWRIVPEFLLNFPEKHEQAAKVFKNFIDSADCRHTTSQRLKKVRESLGERGAAKRAARAIIDWRS